MYCININQINFYTRTSFNVSVGTSLNMLKHTITQEEMPRINKRKKMLSGRTIRNYGSIFFGNLRTKM